MKCTKGTNMVCYHYEYCEKAQFCNNVPKGIREKLSVVKKHEAAKFKKLETEELYAKLKT